MAARAPVEAGRPARIAIDTGSRGVVLRAGGPGDRGQVAAVLPRDEKSERELIFTVAGVTVLSTLAMIFYPSIAAWLAGSALGATSMSIHHKLCHTLGGAFNLAHADVHTVILPHATAFNREAAPHAMRIVAAAVGARDAAQGIYDLAVRLGAPIALKNIGMPHEGLDRAARLATENPYYNPRPIEYAGVRQLLEDAYQGTRPG